MKLVDSSEWTAKILHGSHNMNGKSLCRARLCLPHHEEMTWRLIFVGKILSMNHTLSEEFSQLQHNVDDIISMSAQRRRWWCFDASEDLCSTQLTSWVYFSGIRNSFEEKKKVCQYQLLFTNIEKDKMQPFFASDYKYWLNITTEPFTHQEQTCKQK